MRGDSTETVDRGALEQQTFLLVNQYRQAHGMMPLRWDDAIAKSARGHSRDMATGKVDFGHDGFTDRVMRLKDVLPGLRGGGENVLNTDDPDDVAQRAVAIWLKSPAHLRNIRGDFNCSGLGVWVSKEGVIYFTQLFIKLEPKAAAVDPQPTPEIKSPYILPPPMRSTPLR